MRGGQVRAMAKKSKPRALVTAPKRKRYRRASGNRSRRSGSHPSAYEVVRDVTGPDWELCTGDTAMIRRGRRCDLDVVCNILVHVLRGHQRFISRQIERVVVQARSLTGTEANWLLVVVEQDRARERPVACGHVDERLRQRTRNLDSSQRQRVGNSIGAKRVERGEKKYKKAGPRSFDQAHLLLPSFPIPTMTATKTTAIQLTLPNPPRFPSCSPTGLGIAVVDDDAGTRGVTSASSDEDGKDAMLRLNMPVLGSTSDSAIDGRRGGGGEGWEEERDELAVEGGG